MRTKGIGTAGALLIAALAVGLAPTAAAEEPRLVTCITDETSEPGVQSPGNVSDCEQQHVAYCEETYPMDEVKRARCLLLYPFIDP